MAFRSAVFILVAVVLLAPTLAAATDAEQTNDDDAAAGSDHRVGSGDRPLYAGFGLAATAPSATTPAGDTYTSFVALPTFHIGTQTPYASFDSDVSLWPLLLFGAGVPFAAGVPYDQQDFSWWVRPTNEDPALRYHESSLLNLRLSWTSGETEPPRLQLAGAIHLDVHTVTIGPWLGGFDFARYQFGGTECVNSAGGALYWDVVDQLRVDVWAMGSVGWDPTWDKFVTSWGGRGYVDVTWALWPDVVSLRGSGRVQYINWIRDDSQATFVVPTGELSLLVHFEPWD
jgi:hypothetical protein